jgi:hypothetical protein
LMVCSYSKWWRAGEFSLFWQRKQCWRFAWTTIEGEGGSGTIRPGCDALGAPMQHPNNKTNAEAL